MTFRQPIAMDKNKLYQSLFNVYVLAYPPKTKKMCQDELIIKWNSIKNDTDLAEKVNHISQELMAISVTKKGSLINFWTKKHHQFQKKFLLRIIYSLMNNQLMSRISLLLKHCLLQAIWLLWEMPLFNYIWSPMLMS